LFVGLLITAFGAGPAFRDRVVFNVRHRCRDAAVQCATMLRRGSGTTVCTANHACPPQKEIFLYVMLPTIMFEAGYGLQPML
jgi:hypothetical protein